MMPGPQNPGPHPHPHRPGLALPAGACDAHCHIFGPISRFPYAPDRSCTPPEAPLSDLQALHRLLGLERAVIVQSAAHGSDHASLVAALRQGEGRYRGVALVRPDTPPAEVARLHDAGVRGARLHFTPHLGKAPTADEIDAVVRLIAPHGWHIALHVAGAGIAEHADLVRSLPLPVVIDHMARVDLRAGLASPAVTALRGLLDTGDVWPGAAERSGWSIRVPSGASSHGRPDGATPWIIQAIRHTAVLPPRTGRPFTGCSYSAPTRSSCRISRCSTRPTTTR